MQRGVVNPESLSLAEHRFAAARMTSSFEKKTRYELFAELNVIRSDFSAKGASVCIARRLLTDCEPRFHLRRMVSSRRFLALDALHLSRAQGVLNLIQK